MASFSINLDLQKRRCRHCWQTIFRFGRERWCHVVPRTPYMADGPTAGHFASRADEEGS